VGRRGMDVNRSLRLVSLLVSHGFLFMNGFALVALREIVLSSLPTASILSLLLLLLLPPPSIGQRPPSEARVALLQSEWKTAANRYFSQARRARLPERERERERDRERERERENSGYISSHLMTTGRGKARAELKCAAG